MKALISYTMHYEEIFRNTGKRTMEYDKKEEISKRRI